MRRRDAEKLSMNRVTSAGYIMYSTSAVQKNTHIHTGVVRLIKTIVFVV